MSTLLKRLSRLSGDNPVQWVKVTPDDWVDLLPMLEDAERYRYVATLGALPTRTVAGYHYSDGIFHKTVNAAIDAARNTTNKESA